MTRAEKERLRYQTDPDFREKKKARNRASHKRRYSDPAFREAKRKRDKLYWLANAEVFAERYRKWKESNPERFRELRLAAERKRRESRFGLEIIGTGLRCRRIGHRHKVDGEVCWDVVLASGSTLNDVPAASLRRIGA